MEVQRIGGAAGTSTAGTSFRMPTIARVPMTSGTGLFTWQNTTNFKIFINRLWLDISTPSGGACVCDAGTINDLITTNSDNLIDGASLATARIIDNFTENGANGLYQRFVLPNFFVQGRVVSGSATGLVGVAYFEYVMS
jgi:hypothetical protein